MPNRQNMSWPNEFSVTTSILSYHILSYPIQDIILYFLACNKTPNITYILFLGSLKKEKKKPRSMGKSEGRLGLHLYILVSGVLGVGAMCQVWGQCNAAQFSIWHWGCMVEPDLAYGSGPMKQSLIWHARLGLCIGG